MNGSIRRNRIVLAAVASAGVLIVFGLNAGRMLVVDAPQPSDVIVVLAGETDRRPARALQLLDQGYARRVLIDVPAAAEIYGFTEMQLAEKYVKGLPQATSVAVCPIEGLSTTDESRDVERCLVRENGTTVLIVTSDFHTRRSLSIFRRKIPGKSWSVAAAHDDIQFGVRWWARRQWAKTCVDEWLRLLWWTLVERWR